MALGGRIKLLSFNDFRNLQGNNGFNIFLIPDKNDPDARDNRFFMGAQGSRIKIDGKINSTNDRQLRAYIEGDFEGVSGAFRLRHAFLSWEKWLFGQTWSIFTDEEVFPSVIDNDGPATCIFARNPQIRFSPVKKKKTEVSVGIEYLAQNTQAYPELDSLVGTTYDQLPDFTAKWKQRFSKGHIQLSGVLRGLAYKSSGVIKKTPAAGLSLSFMLFTGEQSNLIMQGVYGKGISRYLNGFSIYNLDGIPDGNGNLDPVPVLGYFVGYQFNYGNKKNFNSSIVYGYSDILNETYPLLGRSFVRGNYLSANIMLIPYPRVNIGFEGCYGNRFNYLNQSGNAFRIQFVAFADF